MLNFLKDRILLFVLVIAGDFISLAAFIKAAEIKQDAITIAAAVSLLPSLIISLVIKYFFQPKVSRRKFVIAATIISVLLWVGFIFAYLNFSKLNNQYGKWSFPKNSAVQNSPDSIIVGGCNYTLEAQAEVDAYAAAKRTLTPAQLFADFNYDIAQVWTEKERDCARGKILNSFAVMLGLLIAGISLTCELLITGKQEEKKG